MLINSELKHYGVKGMKWDRKTSDEYKNEVESNSQQNSGYWNPYTTGSATGDADFEQRSLRRKNMEKITTHPKYEMPLRKLYYKLHRDRRKREEFKKKIRANVGLAKVLARAISNN